MTLKWGSTTVTAIKWGSTNCTAVYWGSTKVFPEGVDILRNGSNTFKSWTIPSGAKFTNTGWVGTSYYEMKAYGAIQVVTVNAISIPAGKTVYLKNTYCGGGDYTTFMWYVSTSDVNTAAGGSRITASSNSTTSYTLTSTGSYIKLWITGSDASGKVWFTIRISEIYYK